MQQKVQGLNKEFKKTDVNRMRNLIQGKGSTSTGKQIGYNKKTEDYIIEIYGKIEVEA